MPGVQNFHFMDEHWQDRAVLVIRQTEGGGMILTFKVNKMRVSFTEKGTEGSENIMYYASDQ